MRTIVISLEKSLDRQKFMKNQLQHSKVDFEFFTATDGTKIDNEWIDKNLSKSFRKEHEKYKNRFITKGALACQDSHRQVWKKIIDDGHDDYSYLILEDDCYIPPSSIQNVQEVANFLPTTNYEFVLLYYSSRNSIILSNDLSTPINAEYRIFPYPDDISTGGSLAYLISKEGAKKLLSSQESLITRMADSWDFKDVNLNAAMIHPLPIFSAGFPSTITNRHLLSKAFNFRTDTRRFLLNSLMSIPLMHKVLVPYLRSKISKVIVK